MEFTGERFIPSSETGDEITIEHLQRYYSAIPLAKDKVILDAASGEGYGTSILAEVASQAIGLEIDAEATTHAKNQYPKPNLQFINGSIGQIPLANASVDRVFSFETIEHVDHELQCLFLDEIKRVLNQDERCERWARISGFMRLPDNLIVPPPKNRFSKLTANSTAASALALRSYAADQPAGWFFVGNTID